MPYLNIEPLLSFELSPMCVNCVGLLLSKYGNGPFSPFSGDTFILDPCFGCDSPVNLDIATIVNNIKNSISSAAVIIEKPIHKPRTPPKSEAKSNCCKKKEVMKKFRTNINRNIRSTCILNYFPVLKQDLLCMLASGRYIHS